MTAIRIRTILELVALFLFALPMASQTYEVYVSDTGNRQTPPYQILKFDVDGGNPTVFISTPLSHPQDILFLEDSNIVLISNFGSGRISRHDATTGEFLSEFATGLAGPTRIKIGPDGLLYVLQWSGSGRVRRYTLEGQSLGNFTELGLPQSIGLDWDGDGNLYVSSYTEDIVMKYDTSGATVGAFITSNLQGPTNIWFDENGDLLVLDYDGTGVKRFDSSGNYLGDFIQGVRQGEGVGFLPNGDILIGDEQSRSVKQFDSTGKYLRDFAPPRTLNMGAPNAVVVREIAPPVPLSPDRLVGQLSGLTVVLTWHDNSDGEDGFRIHRRTDGGTRASIAEVGDGVTTYVDATIESGHRYEYSVTSFTGNVESTPSNVAGISTDCYRPVPSSPRGRPVRREPLPCRGAVGERR